MSLVQQTLQGKYYLEAKIGGGAFGQTYKARDTSYRSQVYCVVKHLTPDLTYVPDAQRNTVIQTARQLFDREIDTLKKLGSYSNQIPLLLDSFEENNEFYLVQEWIDGEPLSKSLIPGFPDNPGTKITQRETIAILQEILVPLEFCHREEVVHRDLKPDNIMRREKDGKLVLIDFGAVKNIGQVTLLSTNQMRPGTVIGTEGFMPPEQNRGVPIYASDVYAVGMLAIQALTGIAPHLIPLDYNTNEFIWRKYCHVTDAFADILTRMVKQIPAQRYPHATTVRDALATLPNTSTTILSPPPTPVVTPPPQPTTPTPRVNPPNPSPAGISLRTLNFESARVEMDKGFLGLGEKKEIPKIVKIPGTVKYFVEMLPGNVPLEMICVSGGTFMMGSPDGERYNSEKPQHRVDLPDFYMARYPTTQAQYLAVMGENPSRFKGDRRPVECVSWLDAMEFCQKLSKITSREYTLPSESQWEYACRGNVKKSFSFGDIITTDVVNYNGNYTYGISPKGVYREQTTDVGTFPANDFGLHDMHGNVWEWCLDDWHDSYKRAPNDGSPWLDKNSVSGTSVLSDKVLRGGAWDDYPSNCRSANRYGNSRGYRNVKHGFRVVVL
jgi:eukaryotic-like serine/threonine-protein kinase